MLCWPACRRWNAAAGVVAIAFHEHLARWAAAQLALDIAVGECGAAAIAIYRRVAIAAGAVCEGARATARKNE